MSALRDWTLLSRLARQARPYWPHIAGLFAFGFASPVLKLLAPVPLALAVDCVLGGKPAPGVLGSLPSSALLAIAAGFLVVLAFATQAMALAHMLLSIYAGERLVLGFRAALFRHAQRLSLSYHDVKGTTDSTYRILYDAPAIQWVMVEGLVQLVSSVFTFAAMLVVTASIEWRLAAVALMVSPILVVLTQFFRDRLRRRTKELKNEESAAATVVQEVLGALRVVKAFGREDEEQDRFIRRAHEGLKARLSINFGSGLLGFLVALVTSVGTAAVLYIGMRQIQAGSLTLGELLLVMAYLTQLYAPLEAISKKIVDLQGSLTSAERAFSLLDQEQDVAEQPNSRPLRRAEGAIEFRNVCFSYDGSRQVLEDVSFDIPAGARVGIAGQTGAGKSTLVNLLVRFYDPTQGQILLDGVDLRDYRLVDLRDQFAFVLQEPVLFSSSIAENIAYARPAAAEAEIVAAAKAANAHDFIQALPKGYQTTVGERGMQLSGGERQRIALARAFLKDAPILILDEPTSSVDMKTEELILEAMERLMKGRTTFIIAHRLTTIRRASKILLLDQGTLVEVGSFDELTTANGSLRSDLCHAQSPSVSIAYPDALSATLEDAR
jgi:ATP-binding cassette, subfamily B, bacterial